MGLIRRSGQFDYAACLVLPWSLWFGRSASKLRARRFAATGWSWSLFVVHLNRFRTRASDDRQRRNTGAIPEMQRSGRAVQRVDAQPSR